LSYQALVCRVSTRPHPNADKLQLATANGYQVVVGLDVKDGELGVFFGPDGQLSEEMCAANDLIGYTDPETGEKRGGFFAKNRRVRAQRFRGEKSDGYWTPLSSFAFTGVDLSTLTEGMQFDSLNGVPICNKYYTPATLKAMQSGGKQKRQNDLFAKHIDTAQLKHHINNIEPNSVIYITEKLHGTSGRFGYVLEEKTLKRRLRDRIRRRPARTVREYNHLLGTRNTILADHTSTGFYGSEEFRWNAIEKLVGNLHKGEILYFELVGYTTDGKPIMSEPATDELKEIKKQYGKKMTFSYGTEPGQCDLYVYRITRVNEDGNVVELSWPQVKARCNALGIKHVPELLEAPVVFYNGSNKSLEALVDSLMEGPSTIDSRHIREGVVVRVEGKETNFFKAKSFTFGVLEGYLKNSDDYVDLEEAS